MNLRISHQDKGGDCKAACGKFRKQGKFCSTVFLYCAELDLGDVKEEKKSFEVQVRD